MSIMREQMRDERGGAKVLNHHEQAKHADRHERSGESRVKKRSRSTGRAVSQ